MAQGLSRSRTLCAGGLALLAGMCAAAATLLIAGRAVEARASGPATLSRVVGRPPASQPTPSEFQVYYEERLSQIQPKDAEGLFALALLCANRQRPDLAADLCRRILESYPTHSRARSLWRVSSLRLAASRPAATRPAMTRPGLTVSQVLSPEGINRLRLAEFDSEQMTDRPRVSIARGVIQDFLVEADRAQAMTAADLTAFMQAPNDDKVRWFIRIFGNRYLDRVQMTSDPQSMLTFRQRVWPILSRGCAAPGCHAPGSASPLHFVLPVTYGPAMATNFYTVNRYDAADGPLVNRDRPEASLLLQFGLSPEYAEFKHPTAIPPLFRDRNDPRYQIVLDWIRQLRTPAPDYRITEGMWQNFPVRPATLPAE